MRPTRRRSDVATTEGVICGAYSNYRRKSDGDRTEEDRVDCEPKGRVLKVMKMYESQGLTPVNFIAVDGRLLLDCYLRR